MYLLLEFNDSILLLVHQTIDCSNTTLMSVYLHRTQCHLISVHHSWGYYLGRFFWGVRYHFFSKRSLFVIIYVCIADICKQTTFYNTTSLFFAFINFLPWWYRKVICLGNTKSKKNLSPTFFYYLTRKYIWQSAACDNTNIRTTLNSEKLITLVI